MAAKRLRMRIPDERGDAGRMMAGMVRNARVDLLREAVERAELGPLAVVDDASHQRGLVFKGALDARSGQDVVERIEENAAPGLGEITGLRLEKSGDRGVRFSARESRFSPWR